MSFFPFAPQRLLIDPSLVLKGLSMSSWHETYIPDRITITGTNDHFSIHHIVASVLIILLFVGLGWHGSGSACKITAE